MDAIFLTLVSCLTLALDFLSSLNPMLVAGLATVLEVGLRFKATEKPLSLLRVVPVLFRSVGKVLVLASEVLAKGADLLDKVLPQKLK